MISREDSQTSTVGWNVLVKTNFHTEISNFH